MPSTEQVLVVGGGFLGLTVARGLTAAGHEVTVLSRSFSADVTDVHTVVGDAADPNVVDGVLNDSHVVVYCAGGRDPSTSDLDPVADLVATVPPLLSVLGVLRDRGHGQLLAMSSGGTVYGEPISVPVTEAHPLSPASSYGILKAASEHYLRLYASQFGVHTTSLRCGNVYGPGQRPFRSQGVIASMLGCARSGRRFTIFGDGNTVRDYIYVDDVVDAVARLLRLPLLPTAINVATGTGTSVHELVELVANVTGHRLAVQYEPARPSDLKRVVLDVSELRRLTDIEPIGLREGIERTWACADDVARSHR